MPTKVTPGGWALRRPIRHRSPFPQRSTPRASRAFTLIEIMIVVGIMIIVMAMGVPLLYQLWHKEGLRKAVSDVEEVCSNARARAIWSGKMTDVVFNGDPPTMTIDGSGPAPPGSGLSASFELTNNIAIALIKVDGKDFMHETGARVHFYPNGMCDELRIILKRIDDGQLRGISLEVTSSLSETESDQFKLQAELR